MFEEKEFFAICKHYIPRTYYGIVANSLHYYFIVNLNFRSLTLDKNMWFCKLIHHDYVGSLMLSVDIYGILLRDAQFGDMTLRHQPRNGVLAYPLLGGKQQPLSAKRVPNIVLPLILSDSG